MLRDAKAIGARLDDFRWAGRGDAFLRVPRIEVALPAAHEKIDHVFRGGRAERLRGGERARGEDFRQQPDTEQTAGGLGDETAARELAAAEKWIWHGREWL